MNIGYFGVYTENAVNGVDVTGYIVAKEIAKLGHNVFCYAIGENDESYEESNINVKIFKKGSKYALPSSFKEHIKSNRDGIEIFHLRSVFIFNNYLVSKFLKQIKMPYVITPHGGFDKHILTRGRLLKKIYFYLFERHYLNNANGVISCSGKNEEKDILDQGYNSLIRNIWDPVYTDINFTPKNNKRLIYLGRYDQEHKGLDKLLYLFKEISGIDPEYKLDMYGSGPDLAALNQLREELKLENVTINEPIYGSDKDKELNNCNAYIQISRWEAFGRSIVEAICQGLPVIISSGFNLKDLVEENNLGLIISDDLAQSAKDIIKFLSDYNEIEKISKRNIEFSRIEFDPSKIAQLNIDFYREALAQSS